MEPTCQSSEFSMPNESAGTSSQMTNASQTEIRVEYLRHNWTVKNFSHCYQEYLENYVNLPNSDLTWSIKIYPKGNGENNKDFVFLCLNRVLGNNVKNNKIGFRSRFYLKNNEGKDIEMRIHPNPSHSDYVSYIKRDVLFPQIQPADSITVFVEIDIAVEIITTSVDDSFNSSRTCTCERQLGDDYLKLLTDNVLTDFTIKVQDKSIQVHKAILAARSPVFAAMLQHVDTNEVKTGILEIKDVEYNVVREMLTFIYCGKSSSELNEIASDLLIAADKYRLEELKSHCEHNLIQAINLENACDLLIIADMYGASNLRKKVIHFINQQPKKIVATSGWQTIISKYAHLATEIVASFQKS